MAWELSSRYPATARDVGGQRAESAATGTTRDTKNTMSLKHPQTAGDSLSQAELLQSREP
jgi:hypothetical protein